MRPMFLMDSDERPVNTLMAPTSPTEPIKTDHSLLAKALGNIATQQKSQAPVEAAEAPQLFTQAQARINQAIQDRRRQAVLSALQGLAPL